MSINTCSQCANPLTQKVCIANFNQIKTYRSQFQDIRKAVGIIKRCTLRNSELMCIHRKAQSIFDKFNQRIADYKNSADYHENITSLQQLDELETRLIVIESNLQKLKKYRSKITLVKKAIKKIPRDIEIGRASEIIKKFNKQLANYKRMASYQENISNEDQLRELEQRLSELGFYNKPLKKLWRVLPIACKPRYQDPFQMREWFQNPQNQHLLANVTSLRLNSLITVLPPELSKLSNLTELDLSSNRLTVFPEWISRYPTLKKLNLSFNKLENFPIAICQCITLENLDISNNQIKELPKEILQLSHLTELNLRMNKITAIPDWIRRSTKLKVLNLSYNELREIPIIMSQCLALEILNVSNNFIENLPSVFTMWKDVRELLIAKGRTNLGQLEEINLTNNPAEYRQTLGVTHLINI